MQRTRTPKTPVLKARAPRGKIISVIGESPPLWLPVPFRGRYFSCFSAPATGLRKRPAWLEETACMVGGKWSPLLVNLQKHLGRLRAAFFVPALHRYSVQTCYRSLPGQPDHRPWARSDPPHPPDRKCKHVMREPRDQETRTSARTPGHPATTSKHVTAKPALPPIRTGPTRPIQRPNMLRRC